MATPQTAQAQVIDIPVLGMNARDPLLNMDPRYGETLYNVDTDGQKLSVRMGFEHFGTVIDNADYILGLGVHGDPSSSSAKLFAYCQGAGDGVDTHNKVCLGAGDGTFSVAYTLAGRTADEAYPINYKNQLGFAVEANPANDSARYNGSSWSHLGFTVGGFDISARGGCEYKGRVYLTSADDLYYSSGTPGAVTGACTKRSLGDFFRYYDIGGFIETLSSPGNRPSETYLAIGRKTGEILVYGGDYPDSATWSLVGKYKTAPLVGYRAALAFNNDIWIPTIAGIVSLRALMTNGIDAAQQLSPTYMIQPYWTALMNAAAAVTYSSLGISMAYWPEKNKVYVFIPVTANYLIGTSETNAATILVYDVSSGAWTQHEVPSTICTNDDDDTWFERGGLTYYKNNVYFYCGPNVYRYSESSYLDDNDPLRTGTSAFFWAVYGTHNTFGNASKKQLRGWNPLIKIDNCEAGGLYMQTSIDVGRVITSGTYPTPIDGLNSLTVMNGGLGSSFQWRLIGLTNGDMSGPIELYSMGAIL